MAYNLIGKDFTPMDVEAKVTGRAKYAEDFRAENMVFCKTLTSPIPHAKIKHIDTSESVTRCRCITRSPRPGKRLPSSLTSEASWTCTAGDQKADASCPWRGGVEDPQRQGRALRNSQSRRFYAQPEPGPCRS